MDKKSKKKTNSKNNKTAKSKNTHIREKVIKSTPESFKKEKTKDRKKESINIFEIISDTFSTYTSKISFIHFSIATLAIFIAFLLMPILFNMPFNTLNNSFDLKISGAYYFAKFILIDILALLLIFVLHNTFLKPITLWSQDQKNAKYNNLKASQRIKNSAHYTPYIMFFTESLLPVILVIILNIKNFKTHPEFIAKMSLFTFSLSILFATFSYIFTDKTYKKILNLTYRDDLKVSRRFTLKKKILIFVLPLILSFYILVSLVGYSYNTKSNLSLLHDIYSDTLSQIFVIRDDPNYSYSHQRIKNLLIRAHIPIKNDKVSVFIMDEKAKVTSIVGDLPSSFMKNYILDLYNKDTKIAYDGYAFDRQAAVEKIDTNNGTEYACIMYSSDAKDSIILLIISSMLGCLLVYISILVFMNDLAKELDSVASEINFVSSNNEKNNMQNLKIISNNELADIKTACNKFQALKKGNIEMIENNQDLLRYASLGQTTARMINNVYEPVQNIIKENRFLSNTVVTLHDAKSKEEINSHSEKIKTDALYVNEIISAIKGHTSTIADGKIYPFNITDLFKQVALLTKANFISSGTKLSVENPINPRVLIYGNMDIMVQILSNMVSNAINSYEEMDNPNKEIRLSAMLDNDKNSILISIRDFGPGLPAEVTDKLFKEMVKGERGGSGLGLYIAYENIKTHFHGTIDYTTSSEGTTFIISIPIYKK